MAQYLIAFNQEWVPAYTAEEFEAIARDARTVVAEMEQAGVLVFTGGLDDEAPVFSVEPRPDKPVVTDGPFVETKEHLGGLAVVDVPDEATARRWAERIAVACRWPQEVRRFRPRFTVPQRGEPA